MAIQTAEQAAAWLEGLIDVEKLGDRTAARFSLDPIRELLRKVDQPEGRLRPIHLAGSKGKGSTALFVEALLLGAGLRVGTFVQPHLERWTERFRIDGAEVPGNRLAAAVERLRAPVEALREGPRDLVPSWFDVTTAAAFLLFAEAELDAVVLEVGLGGRLDSTNVVRPSATAITSIELEHTEILGDSVAAIAAEKAGIVKTGVPLVTGALPAAAREVVRARAAEVGAPLTELGGGLSVDVDDLGWEGSRLHVADGGFALSAMLRVLGAHQARNAAVAVACVRRSGLVADATLARTAPGALAAVRLPGRIEVVSSSPLTIVDSCHTAASAAALAHVLEAGSAARTHLVLSISAGKNVEAVVGSLVPLADSITLTCAEPHRSVAAERILPELRRVAPGCEPREVPAPEAALRAVGEAAGPGDRIVVAGSVYLAGPARRILGDGAPVGAA